MYFKQICILYVSVSFLIHFSDILSEISASQKLDINLRNNNHLDLYTPDNKILSALVGAFRDYVICYKAIFLKWQ